MVPLQVPDIIPDEKLAKKHLPNAILTTLKHIFTKVGEDVWLVGGTALSGFYAGHRRSDDIDLFAINPASFKSTLLAIKSLGKEVLSLSSESTSAFYYHADAEYLRHKFTLDVVLDERLKEIGHATQTDSGIWVADLATIFKMKSASLVSRCSEKDLFDLDWFLSNYRGLNIKQLIEGGAEIDAGLNTETLLISLRGALLRKEACRFLPLKSPLTIESAFNRIRSLQKRLIKEILEYEHNLPITKEVAAIRHAYKDQKKLGH